MMFKNSKMWAGLIISAAFVGLFLSRIDIGDMWAAFKQANYIFIIPGVALYFISVLFRAFRWKVLLSPLGNFSTQRLYPVIVVGYMANNILPVRLGEMVRGYYLGKREGISKTSAFATIIVERVFDGLTLLFMLAIAAAFLPFVGLLSELSEGAHLQLWQLVLLATAPFAFAIGVLVWAASKPTRCLTISAYVIRLLPFSLANRVEPMLKGFIEGLEVLRSPKMLFAILFLSLPVWLLEAAMYYVIAFSFSLHLAIPGFGILAAVLIAVTSISNLATSLPSAPGGVGPFEFFAAATLAFLGVEISAASAYAFTLHIALLMPVTIIGLVYLWFDNMSLSQLSQPGSKKTLKFATPIGRSHQSNWDDQI